MENNQLNLSLLKQLILEEMIEFQEIIVQIFNIIDQVQGDQHVISLSKIVAEVCLKKRNLCPIQKQLELCKDQMDFLKKNFVKKILGELGKKQCFHQQYHQNAREYYLFRWYGCTVKSR